MNRIYTLIICLLITGCTHSHITICSSDEPYCYKVTVCDYEDIGCFENEICEKQFYACDEIRWGK